MMNMTSENACSYNTAVKLELPSTKRSTALDYKKFYFIMGHVVISSHLKPDPSKVEAVLKVEPPKDKAGVEKTERDS